MRAMTPDDKLFQKRKKLFAAEGSSLRKPRRIRRILSLGPSLCKHTPSLSLRLCVSALNLKNRDILTHKRQYVSISTA